MAKHNLISVDLAKNVFQVCGMTSKNTITFNKTIQRASLATFMAKQEPCEIAMEACYSSHYWARTFESMGHKVKLIPAQHVTPFVRGNKSDRNDAIAICEAARRPNIIPVPIKSIEQQDIQCLHRMRERHIKQRGSVINQTRGLLSEYGIIAPQGHKAFCKLLREVGQPSCTTLSPMIKTQLNQIADEYYWHTERINEILTSLSSIAKTNPLCEILLSIPGVGIINSTAIFSAIGDGGQFKNARELSVWLGLTPRQYSSGESFKSGGITKRGNRYLRKQLVHGARAVVSRCKLKKDRLSTWVNNLAERRGVQKAYVAMAARIARTAWVLLHKKEMYRAM